jgi:hypothetical protein
MRHQTHGCWYRTLLWISGGLTAVFVAVAVALAPRETPVSSPEVVWVLPTAPAVDRLEPAREMMRMLRTNTARVCGPDSCLERDGVIACAMYAPGHRPRKNGEDTPNLGKEMDEYSAQPGAKWPQPGGLGTPVAIFYSYSNLLDGGMQGLTNLQLRAAVEEALDVWAAESPLIFTEIPDAGPLPTAGDNNYAAAGTPNLRFGHHPIDGGSGVLAHAYYPTSTTTSGIAGDLHFDEAEIWDVEPGAGKIDFLEVCLHEIGHTLGLAHETPPPTAVMNPYYAGRFDGLGTAFLFQDDIDGIQAIYVTGVPSGGCLIEQLVQKSKQAALKNLPRKLLGALDQPQPLYKDLRNFRDTVLNRTDVGRQVVGVYYTHGSAVFAALAERPELASEAFQLVAELRTCLVRDGQIQPNVTIPEATYDRGLAWLDRVETLVPNETRLAIHAVRNSLVSITHAAGNTVTIRFEDAAR